MQRITIDQLDQSLRADIDDLNGFHFYEAAHENATVDNQGYHIAVNAEIGRAGVVFVGSGSSGHTEWYDADNTADALRMFAAEV